MNAETKAAAESLAKARHDLRNPVSHILGFAEMLLEQQPHKAETPFIARLKSLVELGHQLIALINLHLDATKLASGLSNLSLFESELSRQANQVLQLAQDLQQSPLSSVANTRDDLLRISGAARQLLELAGPVFALLRAPEFRESLFPAPAPSNPGAARKPTGKSRILIVDDLPELRQQLHSRLTALGYDASSHSDAPGALQYLALNSVDAILLDISMPGMDGLEVLKALKASPATKAIPVIMLTFAEPPDKLAHCLELGAAGFLPKPCTDLLLQARLQAALTQPSVEGHP